MLISGRSYYCVVEDILKHNNMNYYSYNNIVVILVLSYIRSMMKKGGILKWVSTTEQKSSYWYLDLLRMKNLSRDSTTDKRNIAKCQA